MKLIKGNSNDENYEFFLNALKKAFDEKVYKSRIYDEQITKVFIDAGYEYIAIVKEDKLKVFAIYEPIDKATIRMDAENEMDNYENDEIEDIYSYIEDINPDGIYIKYIESFDAGYGTELIKILKAEHKKIILYADYRACEFWSKKGFYNTFGYTYIYPPKAITRLLWEPENYKDIAWIKGVSF